MINNLSEYMSFMIIHHAIYTKILEPEAKGLFTPFDFPLPLVGAAEILGTKRAVSVYFQNGDTSKGSTYSPTHEMTFPIDLFVSADSKADLLVLEKEFDDKTFQQIAKRAAMNSMQPAERNVNILMDMLIFIVYQLIMRKENDQLGVDRLEPEIKLPVANRMIVSIQKGTPIREDKTSKFVSMEAQMVLKCKAKETVTGQLPVGAVGGGAEFHFDLEVNDDTITKAGILADTTE